jgi:hypothetical protein
MIYTVKVSFLARDCDLSYRTVIVMDERNTILTINNIKKYFFILIKHIYINKKIIKTKCHGTKKSQFTRQVRNFQCISLESEVYLEIYKSYNSKFIIGS